MVPQRDVAGTVALVGAVEGADSLCCDGNADGVFRPLYDLWSILEKDSPREIRESLPEGTRLGSC